MWLITNKTGSKSQCPHHQNPRLPTAYAASVVVHDSEGRAYRNLWDGEAGGYRKARWRSEAEWLCAAFWGLVLTPHYLGHLHSPAFLMTWMKTQRLPLCAKILINTKSLFHSQHTANGPGEDKSGNGVLRSMRGTTLDISENSASFPDRIIHYFSWDILTKLFSVKTNKFL